MLVLVLVLVLECARAPSAVPDRNMHFFPGMRPGKTIQNALAELRRLRDEIRVRLHLGEMDVRDWWEGIEPKLDELESKLEESGGRASGRASVVTEELSAALRRIRDRLGQEREQPQA